MYRCRSDVFRLMLMFSFFMFASLILPFIYLLIRKILTKKTNRYFGVMFFSSKVVIVCFLVFLYHILHRNYHFAIHGFYLSDFIFIFIIFPYSLCLLVEVIYIAKDRPIKEKLTRLMNPSLPNQDAAPKYYCVSVELYQNNVKRTQETFMINKKRNAKKYILLSLFTQVTLFSISILFSFIFWNNDEMYDPDDYPFLFLYLFEELFPFYIQITSLYFYILIKKSINIFSPFIPLYIISIIMSIFEHNSLWLILYSSGWIADLFFPLYMYYKKTFFIRIERKGKSNHYRYCYFIGCDNRRGCYKKIFYLM